MYSYPENRRRVLFERDASQEEEYNFGRHWIGQGKSILKQATRPDVLFLSLATKFNNRLALSVLRWFEEKVRRVAMDPTNASEMFFTLNLLKEDLALRSDALSFLRAADLGIHSFDVKDRPMRQKEALVYTTLQSALENEVELPDMAELRIPEVSTTHRATDLEGRDFEERFGWSEESDGTQKLFSLIGPWIHVLKSGCLLLADELDTQLHPLITRELIRLFHDPRTNERGAQLVFTAHDTSLLSQENFRRDQVWLTEKNKSGATDLYSLWDHKSSSPRTVENLRKHYLGGRYGAIPLLGSFSLNRTDTGYEEEVAQ